MNKHKIRTMFLMLLGFCSLFTLIQVNVKAPLTSDDAWGVLTEIHLPDGECASAVVEVDGNLIVATKSCKVYKSIDEARTWTLKVDVKHGKGWMYVKSLVATSKGWIILHYSTCNYTFYISKDGGDTWSAVIPPNYFSLWHVTELPNRTILAGDHSSNSGGLIYKSDNGLNWSLFFNASNWLISNGYGWANHTHAIYYDTADGRLYACFGDYITGTNVRRGKVTLYSDDTGTTWNIMPNSGGPISVVRIPSGVVFGPDWARPDVWLYNGSIKDFDIIRRQKCDNLVFWIVYKNDVLYVSPKSNHDTRNYGIYFSPDEGKTWYILVETTGQGFYKIFEGKNCIYLIHDASGQLYRFVLKDTDKDGIPDITDTDDDEDGMSDAWEIINGLNHLNASDAFCDNDSDGLTNLQEYERNTDPNNYFSPFPMWIIGVVVAVVGVAIAVTFMKVRKPLHRDLHWLREVCLRKTTAN